MKTTNHIFVTLRFLPIVTALAIAVSVPSLSAATNTWTGGNSTWETPANWDGGIPGDNDTAYLPGNSPNTITISGTTARIASLTATNTVAGWTLDGGTLAFASGGSIVAASGGNTLVLTINSQISATDGLSVTGARIVFGNTNNAISGNLSLGASSRVVFVAPGAIGSASLLLGKSSQAQIGAGILTNAVTLADTGAGIFANNIANKTLEIAGAISESGGVRDMTFSALNDNGTIIISGNNTYTGNTQIGRSSAASGTTIRITHGNAFGSSASSANVTFLTAANTGAQTLEMAGGITVLNRKLTLFGAGIESKGSLFNADDDNVWDGGVDLGATNNATIGVTNGTTLTIKGEVSGSAAGGLTKTGEGALILEGSSSYSTGTTVSQGLLLVENTTGSGTGTGDVSVLSGAAIGGDGTIAGSLDLASGAKFEFTLNRTLKVSGDITFGGFSINDVVVSDWGSVANGTYTLIGGTGTFDYSNVDFGTTLDLGGGRIAGLQQGSLQLNVVPEPGTLWLLGLSGLGMALMRRCYRSRRGA